MTRNKELENETYTCELFDYAYIRRNGCWYLNNPTAAKEINRSDIVCDILEEKYELETGNNTTKSCGKFKVVVVTVDDWCIGLTSRRCYCKSFLRRDDELWYTLNSKTNTWNSVKLPNDRRVVDLQSNLFGQLEKAYKRAKAVQIRRPWCCKTLENRGFICVDLRKPETLYIRNRNGEWMMLPDSVGDIHFISSTPLIETVYVSYTLEPKASDEYVSKTLCGLPIPTAVKDFLSENSNKTEEKICRPSLQKDILSSEESCVLKAHLITTGSCKSEELVDDIAFRFENISLEDATSTRLQSGAADRVACKQVNARLELDNSATSQGRKSNRIAFHIQDTGLEERGKQTEALLGLVPFEGNHSTLEIGKNLLQGNAVALEGKTATLNESSKRRLQDGKLDILQEAVVSIRKDATLDNRNKLRLLDGKRDFLNDAVVSGKSSAPLDDNDDKKLQDEKIYFFQCSVSREKDLGRRNKLRLRNRTSSALENMRAMSRANKKEEFRAKGFGEKETISSNLKSSQTLVINSENSSQKTETSGTDTINRTVSQKQVPTVNVKGAAKGNVLTDLIAKTNNSTMLSKITLSPPLQENSILSHLQRSAVYLPHERKPFLQSHLLPHEHIPPTREQKSLLASDKHKYLVQPASVLNDKLLEPPQEQQPLLSLESPVEHKPWSSPFESTLLISNHKANQLESHPESKPLESPPWTPPCEPPSLVSTCESKQSLDRDSLLVHHPIPFIYQGAETPSNKARPNFEKPDNMYSSSSEHAVLKINISMKNTDEALLANATSTERNLAGSRDDETSVKDASYGLSEQTSNLEIKASQKENEFESESKLSQSNSNVCPASMNFAGDHGAVVNVHDMIRLTGNAETHLDLPTIISKLKKFYQKKFAWLQDVPWLKANFCFDLKVQTKERRGSADVKNFWNYGGNRILVRGFADYGKSILCSLLVQEILSTNAFTFCIVIDLKDPSTGEIDQIILKKLEDIVSTSRERLLNLLKDKYEHFVIFLDGLDELSPETRAKLCDFKSSLFVNATFVVTSRPIATDEELVLKFDQHVEIRGFSADRLLSIVQRHHPGRLATFSTFCANVKINYLEGFPPKYLYFVLNVFLRIPSTESMYYLLLNVIGQLCAQPSHSKEQYFTMLSNLGHLSLNILSYNYNCVTQNALKSGLGEYYDLFRKSNIFTELAHPNKEYLVCSKVLLVFFSTFFLRRKWQSCKVKDEKMSMLNKHFCFGGSVGSFLRDCKSNYFVGVLPEIVLNCESELFQMYYDIGSLVELSDAFDSVHLLLRIGDAFLDRFGFVKIDEEQFQNQFGDEIGLLDFHDCTVDMCFYSNEIEGRNFLKLEILESENCLIIAECVVVKHHNLLPQVRLSTLYDKLYLGFLYSKQSDILPFLCSVLEITEIGNVLRKCTSFGEYIYLVIVSVVGKRKICISIFGNEQNNGNWTNSTPYVHLTVETGHTLIIQSISSSSQESFCVNCLRKEKSKVISILNRCHEQVVEPYVVIYFK